MILTATFLSQYFVMKLVNNFLLHKDLENV